MPKYNLVNWAEVQNGIAKWTNSVLEIPCYWEKTQQAQPDPPSCVLRLIALGPGENQWITSGRWGIYESATIPGQYDKVYVFDFSVIIQFDISVDIESGDTVATYIDGLISGILVTGTEKITKDVGLIILGEAGLSVSDWSSFSTSFDDDVGLAILDVHTFDITFRVVGKLIIEDVAVITKVGLAIKTTGATGEVSTVEVTIDLASAA